MMRTGLIACCACGALGCAVDPATAPQHDGDGDGEVELATLPQLMRLRYHAADTDHDGALSADEVGAFFARTMQRRFDRLAIDGVIRLSALGPHDRELAAPADLNHDGIITRAELVVAHNTLWLERLHAADANHDGLLTRDEVGPVSWVRLQTADRNGDGAVSFDELASAFARNMPSAAAPAAAGTAAGNAALPLLGRGALGRSR